MLLSCFTNQQFKYKVRNKILSGFQTANSQVIQSSIVYLDNPDNVFIFLLLLKKFNTL